MFTMLTVNGNSETNRAAEEVLSKIETPDLYDQGILNQCYISISIQFQFLY